VSNGTEWFLFYEGGEEQELWADKTGKWPSVYELKDPTQPIANDRTFDAISIFVNADKPEAGACTPDDQKLINAKGGGSTATSFPGITAACAKKSFSIFSGIDEAKFNSCLMGEIAMSQGCSTCFSAAAEYGFKKCKAPCIASWCSKGCLACAAGDTSATDACAGFSAPAPTAC